MSFGAARRSSSYWFARATTVVKAQSLARGNAAGVLYGPLAYAASRDVDYPGQPEVVRRRDYDAQVGEHVLNLRAVKEAHAAHDPVRYAVALEGELEPVGLCVHPVEHGAVTEASALAAVGEDVRRDVLRLVVLVHSRIDVQLVAGLRLSPERLALALCVVGDDRVGRGQYVPRGAVVLLEAYGAAALILLLEAE